MPSDLQGPTETCLSWIKSKETFRSNYYTDGKTGWSIGYGHHSKHKTANVERMTEPRAMQLLKEDTDTTKRFFARKLGVDCWNKLGHQRRDAVIRFAYNAGNSGAWDDIGEDLTAGRHNAVADKIERSRTKGHQGKKEVDLSSRRREDAALYREGSTGWSFPPLPFTAALCPDGFKAAVGPIKFPPVTGTVGLTLGTIAAVGAVAYATRDWWYSSDEDSEDDPMDNFPAEWFVSE